MTRYNAQPPCKEENARYYGHYLNFIDNLDTKSIFYSNENNYFVTFGFIVLFQVINQCFGHSEWSFVGRDNSSSDHAKQMYHPIFFYN